MSNQSEHRSIRPAVWIALTLSLLWLIVFAWLMQARFAVSPTIPNVAGLLTELLAAALIPVATFFAVAAAFGRGRPVADADPVYPEDALLAAEADLTGSAARVATVRGLLAADAAALTETGAILAEQATRLRQDATALGTEANALLAASGTLAERIPLIAADAERMAATIAGSGASLEQQASALASEGQRIADGFATAGRSATDAQASLEAANLRLLDGIAALEQRAGQESATLSAQAEMAFVCAEEATAAMRLAVSDQSAALGASLGDARTMLDRIGRETVAGIGQRLDGLVQQAAAFEERIAAQSIASETLAATAERSFQLLDKRLALSASSTRATLDQLAQQVGAVNESADRVAQPLREGKSAATALQEAVAQLRETVMQTIDAMAETLPARTVEAARASETMAGELRALMADVDAAAVKAHELAAPIEAGRATIAAATEAFTRQRESIAMAGEALVVELEQARQLIAEVEQQTQATSLAASTRLVDAMGQVRAVAQQAAGTMRETLDGVIGEARESLSAAASEATRHSFAEPIAAQAREADSLAAAASDRAREASERTASSLLALASTLKAIESRTAVVDERLESLVQRDLNASAALLTDRMAASSAALLDAMGKPLSDEDVERWRKGERSLFGQRAVALLGKADRTALRNQLQSDEEFAALAKRHVLDFEALTMRLGADSPLSRALHQTDMGRIAMILQDAMRN